MLLNSQNKLTYALAFALPGFASLWLLTVPGMIGPSTYAAIAALLLATGSIAAYVWKDQASGSMGRLPHEVEVRQRLR